MSCGSQTEHIPHRVEAWGPAPGPKRRPDRAAGENAPISGDMRKLDTLARPGKDHPMLADHVAAAERGKADIAFPAWAGIAVAAAHTTFGERYFARFGGGAAQHERSAGRRVALVPVVHLQDLDVEFGPEGAGDLSGERPVYAIAIDGDDRRSTLTQQTFTVTVVWNLRGWAIDMVTWLPAVGATVRLEPVGIEVVTGADGSFRFDVDLGLYTVVGTHAGPPVLTGSQQLEIHEYGVTVDLYLFPDSGS